MQHKSRIAVVVSHPIQHFCPQYASWAKNENIELKVFFGSNMGLKKYTDPGFNKEISWGNLQLEKFQHVFLNGENVIPSDKNIDALSLELALSTYQPALIIIYGYFQKLQRRAHKWAKKNKVLIAYISDSELKHKRNRFKDLLKSIFIKRYFSHINFFLSVGNANEEFYRKMNVKEKQFVRMHFPIDIVQYENAYYNREKLRKDIRDEYIIGENEIVLSVVGKLVHWKNQDHLIEALQLLEQQGIMIHLFILGTGQMQEQWQQKAANLQINKVYFTGFVDIEKLPAYYATSDIYIHPASIEPHSIAVSEAIYMGCPVIISDCCGSYGIDDDVQEGKNGYVFKFGNIPDMVSKIQMLLPDIGERVKMSNYSHSIAVKFQQTAHYKLMNELSKRIKFLH